MYYLELGDFRYIPTVFGVSEVTCTVSAVDTLFASLRSTSLIFACFFSEVAIILYT